MEPLYLGLAIGGSGLSALAIWATWRATRANTKSASDDVEMEIIDDAPATLSRPTAARPAAAPRAAPAATPAHAVARPVRVPVVATPPPVTPRAHAQRAPAMILTQGVGMQDTQFDRRARPATSAPPQRAPMRMPPPPKSWAEDVRDTAQPEVMTEWARRQVGPVGPGRVAGACGGCGTRLSVSNARPLRIACPVCGRTKLIA